MNSKTDNLGSEIITYISAILDADEWTFTHITVKELASQIGVSKQAIDGALGHLLKNELVFTRDEEDHGQKGAGSLVGLTPKGWNKNDINHSFWICDSCGYHNDEDPDDPVCFNCNHKQW